MASLETHMKRNLSQDSARCDNVDLESSSHAVVPTATNSTSMRFHRRKKQDSRDNASIYSAKTSTSSLSQHSSIASTSSKLSRIPNTVKSSLKYFVRRNKASVSSSASSTSLSGTAAVDHEKSFASRLRRSTINFGLFRTNQTSKQILPTLTTSSSVIPTTSAASYRPKRRNSVVSLASRLLLSPTTTSTTQKNNNFINENTTKDTNTMTISNTSTITTHTTHANTTQTNDDCIEEEDEEDDEEEEQTAVTPPPPVGSLLFGKQIDDLDFMALPITISEDDITSTLPTNAPTDTSTDSISTSPPALLFKGLVSTTLTTLYTRLMNECDSTLSNYLLTNNDILTSQASDAPIYQQQLKNNLVKEKLLSIISDLYKMIEMVHWDHQERRKDTYKRMMKQAINTVSSITTTVTTPTSSTTPRKKNSNSTGNQNMIDHEQQIFTLSLVKDTISTIKYIMNQCVSQYYKQVEKAMIIPTKGYRIEGNNTYDSTAAMATGRTEVYRDYPIDHKNPDAHWFRTYFYNQDHYTFFGYITDSKEPVMVSIKPEQPEDADRQYRLIIRYKNTIPIHQTKIVQDSFLLDAPNNNSNNTSFVWKSILESNIPHCHFYQDFRMVHSSRLISNGLQDDILRLDENSLHIKYKFGVLLIKEGQTREEEWFANNHLASEPFEEFLMILGQKVSLSGYTGWAAGLDTKSGDSGEYTYINQWRRDQDDEVHQLAFHVSTLIPSRSGDKQQIQRKRHIGNDIVCLIFVEGHQPFNPAAIKSQFLHVFIVVHQEDIADKTLGDSDEEEKRQTVKAWRVEVVSVEDVPAFGPPLPKDALFFDKQELQEFLVAKLVNAEYAAFKSPKFSIPMSRAREGIFANLVDKGYKLASDGATASTQPLHDTSTLTTTLSSTSSSSSFTTATTTDKNSFRSFHKHSKSSSSAITTISQQSHKSNTTTTATIVPSVSKSSNLLQQFTGKKSHSSGGLARRQSTQGILDKKTKAALKSSHTMSDNGKKSNGLISSSRRSRSEQDLLNMAVEEESTLKTTASNFKQRILTSIPRFGQSTEKEQNKATLSSAANRRSSSTSA